MAHSNASDTCGWIAFATHAFVDGELEPSSHAEVQAHLRQCASCQNQVEELRALRGHLRALEKPVAPIELRNQVAQLLAHEGATAQRKHGRRQQAQRLVGVGLAMAASVAFVWSRSQVGSEPRAATEPAMAAATTAPTVAPTVQASLDGFIDQLVTLHSRPLPPETLNPMEVARLEPVVGVPLHQPRWIGATFRGARVHAMNEQRAATLQYNPHGDHRATVYVFDLQGRPLQLTRLAPRNAGVIRMYAGMVRGYGVAVTERSGVGYAVASDVEADQAVELMETAFK